MSNFFQDKEKNKLAEIAEASDQWELLDQGKKYDGLFQSWKCTFKQSDSAHPPIKVFVVLCEGFDDDETRLLRFKQALVESITTQQQRIEMLFEKLYGDRQMFLGE